MGGVRGWARDGARSGARGGARSGARGGERPPSLACRGSYGLAGAAEAVTNGEVEEMETEPARPPITTKYVWSAVAADGTTKKLDPKTDLIPVSAADGDYELGLANFCPYHAVNGLLLHKGTTHT